MPFEGTPDVGSSWFRWMYDLATVNATGVPTTVGFAPNAGAKSQMDAWPNSTLTKTLLKAFESGDQGPLVSFLAARTAYDAGPTRSLHTLSNAVRVIFIHTGGRDCIVPGYGPVEGWEILRAPQYLRPGGDLWLLDNYPHSCSGVGARLPTETEEADLGGFVLFDLSFLSLCAVIHLSPTLINVPPYVITMCAVWNLRIICLHFLHQVHPLLERAAVGKN